ncbi:MAG: indolepyruvate ferredoxin oxidoreductase subunit alpha [candidate division Zixibacteria bacterium]|nr:indolepyruvate ferredoxin oxidoreductase subunit alpha [Candidatus Tariuqbacter arcticus]
MQILLSGDEAAARGAYEAGCRFGAAYPGTPSTEILENFVRYPGVHAQWSPNEKVAFEVGIGASMGGVRALVTMKHVGVNVAADPLMTFSYTGGKGGFVLVSADDPEMHSSQNEQDSRRWGPFAKIPILEPSDSDETRRFVMLAFDISEEFDTPVMVRLTTRTAHSKGLVNVGEARELVEAKYKRNIAKYVMMPNFARGRHTIVEKRMIKLKELTEKIEVNSEEMGGTSVGIVTGGVSYQYVKEVLPDASVFKIGMSYPLPIERIRKFAEKVDRLFVVEELEPFYEEQMKIHGIECEGKRYLSLEGELNPTRLKKGLHIAGIISDGRALPKGDEVIPRPPVLCPGCSHRGVFHSLKKLKADAFGDIGCYTLAGFKPLEALHTTICMGASIGNAIGASLVKGTEKAVAVIGDSTFLHSGITGLLDAVYSQATITVIILDNRATAMTGGQQHPATGYNLAGEPAPAVDIAELCGALGVKNIRLIDPYNLEETKAAIKASMAEEGPSVVITTRPCMLFPKKIKGQAYYITEECNGCGACFRIGCPSVLPAGEFTEKGLEKAIIDASTCTGCEICVQVCPIDVIFPLEKQEA